MEQCAEHYVDLNKGKWRDMNCGIPMAFVCKKDYDNIQPITHLPTAPPQGGCPTNWIKLDDRCYHVEGINDAQKETWQGARDKCAQLTSGGILAVIHSQRTQSELTALMRSATSDVWIGLSDLGAESKFHWVDGTTMDYTNWAWGQPDGNILLPDGSKSDCAKMINELDESGKWNDVACDTYNTYLCQTMPNPSLPIIPPDNTACASLPGYTEYFGDCYKVGPNKVSWSAAKSVCEGEGTVLATISDGFQEAFVQTMVFKNNGDPLYIGLLNDQATGKFTWLDGWPVWYTNWGDGEPSLGSGEACVIITADGIWDNVGCNGLYNPICKQNNGIRPTTHAPGEGVCLEGWLTYGDWCYKFDVGRDFASWPEANDDCQRAHGAQLASIHSKQENEFVRQNAQGVVGVRAIWLGLRRASSGEFQYEDDTPVDYVNWANGEPDGVGQDGSSQDCVEFTDDAYGKWSDDDCYRGAAYLCKMPKMIPFTPTTPLPTATPCPTDPNWVYMHPYCYFVSGAIGVPVKSWNDANNYCMSQGGYLASIHSTTEQNFINSIVRQIVPSYWIGLRETTGKEEYNWIDGTELDFINWKSGQPDDYYGQEACAEMEILTSNGRWNDLNCGIAQAYVCKRPYDNITPVTLPATKKPEGGCPDDWYKVDDKCIAIQGTQGNGAKNFDDARTACQTFPGGELVSVHSQGFQSLFTSLIKQSPGVNVWIGLFDRGSFGKFHWTDESPLDYTNWAAGQPDGIATRPQDIDCVEVTNDPQHPGKWDDVDCALQRAYLCQRPLDPMYGPNPTFGSTCQRAGYQSYFESCFRLDTEPRVFDDAVNMCEAEGSSLATINDGYDEAFAELIMLNNGFPSAWIGLKQDESEEFKWVDGWPLLWTNWAPREPSNRPGEGCVVITEFGDWEDTSCDVQQVSVCKYTSLPKPTTPAPIEGYCPEDWQPFGSNCYKFDVRHDRASWFEAQYDCEASGANLASVHNQVENEFIRQYAQRAIGVTSVWLGLALNDGGDYEWKDSTIVDYTNWANTEPDGDDIDNGCVDMYPDQYGKWEDTDCQSNAAYVCMVPKDNGCIDMYPDQYGKWEDTDCQSNAAYVCMVPKDQYGKWEDTDCQSNAAYVCMVPKDQYGKWEDTDCQSNAAYVCMVPKDQYGKWEDTDCQSNAAYVCMVPKDRYGKWEDTDCQSNAAYVCMVPKDNGCIDMYPDRYGKWEDTDCQSNAAYVCMVPKDQYGKWEDTDCQSNAAYVCMVPKGKNELLKVPSKLMT
ncbi:macrophage mannose receptor 1-like [Amphiura filiformis]|uniref:macrophage mannose receptor 1-like n=1 Tax=Amphiura filiformis TaxID=82378 RepID=UPI003B22576F